MGQRQSATWCGWLVNHAGKVEALSWSYGQTDATTPIRQMVDPLT